MRRPKSEIRKQTCDEFGQKFGQASDGPLTPRLLELLDWMRRQQKVLRRRDVEMRLGATPFVAESALRRLEREGVIEMVEPFMWKAMENE